MSTRMMGVTKEEAKVHEHKARKNPMRKMVDCYVRGSLAYTKNKKEYGKYTPAAIRELASTRGVGPKSQLVKP